MEGRRNSDGDQVLASPVIPAPVHADALGRANSGRQVRKLRRSLQPFRIYIHGNPMPLPHPSLLAHKPAVPLPRRGVVPLPLGRHPRGSGQLTVTEYDGAIWASEAALHAELRSNERAHIERHGSGGGGSGGSSGSLVTPSPSSPVAAAGMRGNNTKPGGKRRWKAPGARDGGSGGDGDDGGGKGSDGAEDEEGDGDGLDAEGEEDELAECSDHVVTASSNEENGGGNGSSRLPGQGRDEKAGTPWGATRRVRIGVAEMMGRRLRMEDAVYVKYAFRGRGDEALFSLYDAHSGSDVAEQAAADYAPHLARELGDGPLPSAAEVEAAMTRAYLALNAELGARQVIGGAVAVTILLSIDESGVSGSLFCSNVGDSRAVLCKGGGALRLSRDFKPFDDDEYERIVELGGFVSLRDGGRVCDDLALTRALGDLHLAKYVSPVPHFRHEHVAFEDAPYLIIGCDGVWDALTDAQAVDAVNATAPDYEKGAAAIRDLAFLHGSTDNISALVVDLTHMVQRL